MTDELSLFCIACKDTHDLTLLSVERIVYALQAAEHDAEIDRGPANELYEREPDAFDCLLTTLGGSHELELYAEHVDQQLLRRRDKAGARAGDEDICRHCGDLIGHGGGGWGHLDLDALAKVPAHRPEPDPERQP
jgi:hypothetical protein